MEKTRNRTVVVARVKSNKGLDQRIEMFTAADIVHLFGLSMGYRPDVAFALGVIARSVPEIQAGEGDLTVESAKKAIGLAELISHCRVTDTLPEDCTQVESVLNATQHIHTLEAAYSDLCSNIPEILDTFRDQYFNWSITQQEKDAPKRKSSFLRRIFNRIAA